MSAFDETARLAMTTPFSTVAVGISAARTVRDSGRIVFVSPQLGIADRTIPAFAWQYPSGSVEVVKTPRTDREAFGVHRKGESLLAGCMSGEEGWLHTEVMCRRLGVAPSG
jgi:hypothetical protein